MAKKRTIYRDSKTGRFISKSTWKRSRAHNGVRYKRERVSGVRPMRPAAPPVFEWLVTFTYDKSGRSFDVIVTSLDETEAVSVAKQFLRDDDTEDFKRIVPSHFHGWSSTPAKGKPTDEDSGNAEYRIDSKTGKIATYNVYKKN